MSNYNQNFGKSSENEALRYLKKQGYRILELNYKTTLGEIDIIARDKGTICFIEVKSRSSILYGQPKEALDKHKQHKISQSAVVYLKQKNSLEKRSRFDVLSVIRDENKQLSFELLKDAFCLEANYAY